MNIRSMYLYLCIYIYPSLYTKQEVQYVQNSACLTGVCVVILRFEVKLPSLASRGLITYHQSLQLSNRENWSQHSGMAFATLLYAICRTHALALTAAHSFIDEIDKIQSAADMQLRGSFAIASSRVFVPVLSLCGIRHLASCRATLDDTLTVVVKH
jgi:hypothetical protein